jgi:CO/xanthine dehydrogenase FAD-binding subunit
VKPAPFAYFAPATLDEALALLAAPESRVLAGGQSLVPMLNFRLARPARLVDINGIAELGVLRRADGVLRIGATVRQAALERSELVRRHWPLLAQAVRHVGHAATRSRGTVCGSVAHADPRAELPVALAALGARFRLRSASGTRTLTAGELFQGPLTTAIADGELLREIEVPPLPEGARTGFAELARTHGAFADAAVAVVQAPGHTTVATLGPRVAGAPTPDEALAQLATGDHAGALVVALAREALAP